MAIAAVVSPADMDLVAEGYRLDILLVREVVADRLQNGVTLLAILLDGECILAVMTDAAGLPLLHVIHGIAAVAVPGNEDLVVAVIAAVDAEMEIVTEYGTGVPEPDLLDGMAFVAAPLNGEGRLAVMTGAAGIAALHLCHGEPLRIGACREDAVVTLVALEESGVEFVAESDRTGFLYFQLDLLGRLVTPVAGPLDGEGEDVVMAGAAGTILFHFRHGVAPVFAVRRKEGVVTIAAAVHLQVTRVGEAGISLEEYLPGGMASTAVLGNGKGGFAVMTGTA